MLALICPLIWEIYKMVWICMRYWYIWAQMYLVPFTKLWNVVWLDCLNIVRMERSMSRVANFAPILGSAVIFAAWRTSVEKVLTCKWFLSGWEWENLECFFGSLMLGSAHNCFTNLIEADKVILIWIIYESLQMCTWIEFKGTLVFVYARSGSLLVRLAW